MALVARGVNLNSINQYEETRADKHRFRRPSCRMRIVSIVAAPIPYKLCLATLIVSMVLHNRLSFHEKSPGLATMRLSLSLSLALVDTNLGTIFVIVSTSA
jgi:hypothetical protein